MERGFIYQTKDGRKTLLEVNPHLLDAQKSTHITHSNLQVPSERGNHRGDGGYTLVHDTHNSSRDKSNVGNVYKGVAGVPTSQNQESQEIKPNVGSVGKYQGGENEYDEDLII